ncbi:hypothetical protein AGMMS49959_07620 [Planctomycetales bacterium]|nr:hypothetical protein AGMMS49959_07620 [Planctomycetales bacterium]
MLKFGKGLLDGESGERAAENQPYAAITGVAVEIGKHEKIAAFELTTGKNRGQFVLPSGADTTADRAEIAAARRLFREL